MRALAVLVLLPLAACNASERDGPVASNSGSATTAGSRSFQVADFTAVDLRGSDDVEVTIGDNFSVRAEGDQRTLDRLEIEVRDGALRIARRDGPGSWFSGDNGARIYVTMPRLEGASVSGSGDMIVARAEGRFRGAVSGSGDLDIHQIAADSTELSISGSGDIDAAGRTGELSASVRGSGDIDAGGLTASRANVSVAGSGNVRATVNGDATVSIAGSGDVDLGGGARCSVSVNGSGEARCG